jgi:hypothetical protein
VQKSAQSVAKPIFIKIMGDKPTVTFSVDKSSLRSTFVILKKLLKVKQLSILSKFLQSGHPDSKPNNPAFTAMYSAHVG